ncbi:MAG: hypothetical protein HWD86_10245 [Kangiellaceae bacterium]|nr:hypothetical protein [Kangiellaceae bacterium]
MEKEENREEAGATTEGSVSENRDAARQHSLAQPMVDFEYHLFSPLGTYPHQTLSSCLGHFIVEKDFIVMSYEQDKPQNHNKLLIAILLSCKERHGFTKLYPLPFAHHILESYDAINGDVLRQDMMQKIEQKYRAIGETFPEFDLYQNAKGASLPLVLGGTIYNTLNNLIDETLFHGLSDIVDGVSDQKIQLIFEALILSNQAGCHLQFQQQAIMSLIDAVVLIDSIGAADQRLAATLQQLLAQLGTSNSDLIVSRYQLAQNISPIEYIKLFTATCESLKRYLLTL